MYSRSFYRTKLMRVDQKLVRVVSAYAATLEITQKPF